MDNCIFTIGYATKPLQIFLQQLKQYDISAVADVRSVPFSNAFFDYHQPAIKSSLEKERIKYVYLGDELGPRSKQAEHYDSSGQVQFLLLMQSPLFLKGVERLALGVKRGYRIALMCAEKSPLDCHRSLLIGYYLLHMRDIELGHILHDGSLVLQTDLERQITTETNIGADLFSDHAQSFERAWKSFCQKKAYRKPLQN
ncbi:MAG: DUF488 domain-containing protein [Pseudomonadales bacterium]|nr:DUF488 domain-containing protein [Pseudomonadales bacterium]